MFKRLLLRLALCATIAAQQAVIAPDKLADAGSEVDEAAIAALPDGSIAAAWVSNRERVSRLLLRTRANNAWSAPEDATIRLGDIFRCAVAGTAQDLWIFWSERQNDRWQIWGREKKGAAWQQPARLTSEGSNIFPRAASSPDGHVFLVWQSFRGGQSDIYLRGFHGAAWSDEMQVSESPANDWEPAVAAGADGAAYIAWDTYDKGNYDIAFRSFENGKLGALHPLTSSAKFQAHADVAVDGRGRPWVAWDESGVNWGKDYGLLVAAPLATPLHRERSVRLASWDGTGWLELRRKPSEVFPAALRQSSEHPRIAFDANGVLTMLFRHDKESYLSRFDGVKWSDPEALPASGGLIEQNPALARDSSGDLWAGWAGGDGVYCARLAGGGAVSAYSITTFQLFTEPFAEAIPVHSTEAADAQAVRGYTIQGAGKQYRIYRGDLRRHTELSPDSREDGSLMDLYRYGLDAASLDFMAAADHQADQQAAADWRSQQLADLFYLGGAFTPFYAGERDGAFPKGSRISIFAARGARMPAISIPVSLTTDRGTDWHERNPEIEPLAEIYAGAGDSYEYEGAPRTASGLERHPEGFLWNALAKGYKLGVAAGSGHRSTHIAYTCLLAESRTREALLDAMRKRHSYAATDNIILDFHARSENTVYLMGDSFHADSAPQFSVTAVGTGAIKQIDIVKNQKFVHTVRPAAKNAAFDYTDPDFGAGEKYYYARVIQEDGQMAWSSPIWVKSDPKPPVVR